MKNIEDILDKVGLSPSEQTVYVALLEGASSVADIMKTTGEKRPTVYYALHQLESRGLVSKTGKEYGNKFRVEPIETLLAVVENNIREQEKLLEDVQMLGKRYAVKNKKDNATVSYYDTHDAIKNIIAYSLYTKNKSIRTIVPTYNFFNDMGDEFKKEYVSEKSKRGIVTQALWENIPNKSIINALYGNKSSIKQLPLEMHNAFKTTIFIYDDKTLYISPTKESFALLIQSKEHASTMNAIFDALWVSGLDIVKK